MRQKIRWGILATGDIARQFAEDLRTLEDAELVAVGSRSQESADVFADKHNIPRRHASYQSLAEDPDIDIIYVATPHTLHKENAILCLESGKHVLCEKPLAINAHDAEMMIGCARERKLFLMEAVWTRFFPLMQEIRRLISENVIGQPKILTADFGCKADFNPQSRIFDPKMAGGALLDIGIYTLSLSSMIFGEPSQVMSMAHLGETGVDERSGILLQFPGNEMSVLYSTNRSNTPNEAVISGNCGQIKIHSQWWRPTKATLSLDGQDGSPLEMPCDDAYGYKYEAEEVMKCIREGKTECEIMPLDETLSVLKTMDTIRKQWNLRYPME